jgi:hypothetical protein
MISRPRIAVPETDVTPEAQEENSADALRSSARLVIFVGEGSAFRNFTRDKDVRDNIQRPRVFYRREVENNPLVVGMAVSGQNH